MVISKVTTPVAFMDTKTLCTQSQVNSTTPTVILKVQQITSLAMLQLGLESVRLRTKEVDPSPRLLELPIVKPLGMYLTTAR